MRRILFTILSVLFVSACTTKPYVIVQVADAQLGFTAASVSQQNGTEYVNDLTYEVECLTKAVTAINEIMPDAVIFTGDQVNYPDNEEQWNVFSEIISGIDESVMVFHVPGNHDVTFSSDGVDSSPFISRYGDDRHVFETQNVRLVCINTNLIKYNDADEDCQFQWMQDVLKDDDKTTLLFGHHPFFLKDIEEEDGYFQIQKSKRHKYFNLFAERGVDAVYAGHLHNSAEGVCNDIPMKTTTSVGFQIGDSRPSVRLISVQCGEIADELLEL